ncbi:Response regulator protein GraR [Bacillus cereus]|nr:Response regulator protein GraR [Bacillus cereus]
MAKIRSHLRRAYGDYAPKVEERMVEQHGLCLYPERLVLKLKNQEIDVTRNEAILLEMLMKNYPRIVSREVLLNKLWDSESYVDDNTLSVNTTRVRKKLKTLQIADAIETIRSVGYRLHITWDTGMEK